MMIQIVTSLLIASLVSTSPVINNSDQQPSTNLDKSEVKNVDGAGFTKYNYDDSEEIGYQFSKREAAESTGPLDQPLVWGARLEKPVEAAAPAQVDVKPGQKVEWALNLNDKKFYSNNDGLDGIEQKKEDSSAPEASKTSSESYDPIQGILPAVLTDKRRLGEDDKTTVSADSVASPPSKVSPVKGEHKPLVKTVVKTYVPAKNVPQHVFTDDQFPAVIKIKGRQYLVIPHQADSTPSTSYLSATNPWQLNLPGQVSALYGAPGQVAAPQQHPFSSFPFYPSFQSSPSTVKVHPNGQAAPVAQTVFGGYPVGGHQAPVAPNFGVYRPVQSSPSVAQSVDSVQQSTVQSAAAPSVPVEGQQQAVVGQVSTGQTVGVIDQSPSVQSVPVFPSSQVFGQHPFAVQSAPGQSFGLAGKYPSNHGAASPNAQPFTGQYPSFQPGQTFQSPSGQGFVQEYSPVQPFAQNFGQYSYPQYSGQSSFGQRFVFVVPSPQSVQQSIPTVTSVSSPPSFGMMAGQSSIPSSWGMHDQPSVASSWGMNQPSSVPASFPSSWGMHDQPSVSSSWGMNEPATKPSSVSPSSEATKNDEFNQSAVHSSSWGMTGEASKPSKPSKVHPVVPSITANDSKDVVALSTDGVKGGAGVQSAPSVVVGVSTSETNPEQDQKVQQGQLPLVPVPVIAEQDTKGQSAPMVPGNVVYQQHQSPYLVPTVSSFTVQQHQQPSPSFSPGYQQIYQVVQPGQSAPNTFQGYQPSYSTPYQSTHQTPYQPSYQTPYQSTYQSPYQSYYPQ